MKIMNAKKKYWAINLQLFADDGAGAESGSDEGGDDEGTGDEEDGEEDESDEDEKKFSQKDIDEAVKKRLAREKRKWSRAQQKKTGEDEDGNGNAGGDDQETKELRKKAAKAEEMELKWTCLEHDVDKSCVDDVLALARVHMAKDEDLDIEDAIDEVLKKYPSFKTASGKEDEEEGEKKSWGQRQNGARKKTSGVEAAFLKRNPGLKIDW